MCNYMCVCVGRVEMGEKTYILMVDKDAQDERQNCVNCTFDFRTIQSENPNPFESNEANLQISKKTENLM